MTTSGSGSSRMRVWANRSVRKEATGTGVTLHVGTQGVSAERFAERAIEVLRAMPLEKLEALVDRRRREEEWA